jgi:hypothetical protein
MISVPGKAFPELQGKRDDEEVKEKDISRSPPSPSPPRRSEKEKELRSPPRSRTLPRTLARYEPYREPYGPRERSRGGEVTNNVNGRREVLEARYGARRDRIDRYRSRRSRSPRGRRQEGQYERYRT